jgi:hypothetical protein
MWNPFKVIKTQPEALKPEEIDRIAEAYGTLLENESMPMVMDESLLPASKEVLKKALWFAILKAESQKERDAYKCAYLLLSCFRPDVEPKTIPLAVANVNEWDEVAEKVVREMVDLKKEIDLVERKIIEFHETM